MRELSRACPYMARAVSAAGMPPLRRWSPGFDGLARIVVGQQLSTASANAILGRLQARVAPLDAAGIRNSTDEALLGCGLSRGKLATLRALAVAIHEGAIDLDALHGAPPETVHAELTSVRGIGPWTADIYLVFCRGDRDVFPKGDLALQLAVQDLLSLDERPSPTSLAEIAERWRPWRAVAARLLWSYYAVRKAERASR